MTILTLQDPRHRSEAEDERREERREILRMNETMRCWVEKRKRMILTPERQRRLQPTSKLIIRYPNSQFLSLVYSPVAATQLSAGLSIHRRRPAKPSPLPSNPSNNVVRRLSLPVSYSLFSLLSSLVEWLSTLWCSIPPTSSTSIVTMEPQTQEASNSQRHTSDQNVHNVSDHVDEDVTSNAVDMDQYRINSWEDIGKIDF
ncbi:hypothetical protein Ahy_A04g018302 isoform A [Arachis hypogaea]|uniref:Uncharacterized protein n=1 Tax=Arachis hypogaea TaxID=3818 RepID=A0A445DDG5_ARAHY|nr:hypothetical protein Ahy_A04g018302 isoform A [Arachis hypogaea]